MELLVSAKQLGRKNPVIRPQSIEIGDIGTAPTVQRLIEAVVTQQVREYNGKPYQQSLLPFLDQQSIDAGAGEGKVGFGSIYNENKADPAKACQIAILAFQDGLFAVFANDVEFTKTDQQVPLEKDTIITFIRLTFLAGGFW